MIRRIIFILLCMGVRGMAGQVAASSTQSQEEIEDVGEIVPAEGELKRNTRASLSVNGDFTSNAELTGYHDSGDFIFRPTLALGYNTPLGHRFTLDMGVKVESGIYAEFDNHSFVGYSFNGTLDWRPTPNAPRIYVGFDPYRYDSFDTGERIAQALGFTAGTDWGVAFNQGLTLAFVGYSFSEYLADPSMDSRGQHRVVTGLTHQFRPQFFGQLFYAWQYSDYYNNDRHDSKHLLGVNLTYQIRRNIFTTLSGNWATNDSDAVKASYESAGASLGLTWQF
jgi:hypothetical protein